MSDNDGEGFFLPFPFAAPSEEMLEKMREMRDHQEMVADDYRHSTARLFDGLSEDQLMTLKTMFHIMAVSSGAKGRTLAVYYEGVIVGLLHAKFGVCLGCDHNHDKVMEEQMQREAANHETPPMDGGDPFKPGEMGMADCPIGGNTMLSNRQSDLMAEYNLDDVRDENLFTLLGFICTKCKMAYPTIEDRMLKGPDDCSGCHQKEMWG